MIEKYGSGIGRIRDYFKEDGLPEPEFRNISDGFQVTVFGEAVDDVTEKDGEKDGEKINNRQKEILSLIQTSPNISAEELASRIGINTRNMEKNIAKLKALGIIERIGEDKGGYWKVK